MHLHFHRNQEHGRSPRTARTQYRRDLVKLTEGVIVFLRRLDELMQQPSTVERGRKIAALSNALEMMNDQIRYESLGINFRTDDKRVGAP